MHLCVYVITHAAKRLERSNYLKAQWNWTALLPPEPIFGPVGPAPQKSKIRCWKQAHCCYNFNDFLLRLQIYGFSFLLCSGFWWVSPWQCAHWYGRLLSLLFLHGFFGWGQLWSRCPRQFRDLWQYFSHFWSSFFFLYLHFQHLILYYFFSIYSFCGWRHNTLQQYSRCLR